MNVFLYVMIFIAGTVFGSFFSLAVYRIPRKENIVYVQSHCTTCNHKLVFWDLIPVFSYLFLGGRCRYCKEKIRPRYLILEVFSGLVFMLLALSYHISIFSTPSEFISLGLAYLFLVGIFIVGGIDKENYLIPDSVCLYMVVIACLKLLYLGIFQHSVANHLVGFLGIPAVLLLIDLVCRVDHTKEEPIGLGDIKYLAITGLFMGFGAELLMIPLSLLLALVGFLIHHFQKIPWGFYLSVATVVILILENYLQDVIDLISVGT